MNISFIHKLRDFDFLKAPGDLELVQLRALKEKQKKIHTKIKYVIFPGIFLLLGATCLTHNIYEALILYSLIFPAIIASAISHIYSIYKYESKEEQICHEIIENYSQKDNLFHFFKQLKSSIPNNDNAFNSLFEQCLSHLNKGNRLESFNLIFPYLSLLYSIKQLQSKTLPPQKSFDKISASNISSGNTLTTISESEEASELHKGLPDSKYLYAK